MAGTETTRAAEAGAGELAPVHFGTTGLSYPRWVGNFYPPGTRPVDFLTAYARRLRLLELDTTYYGTPTPERVAGWASRVPDGFRFAAKVPRTITQERKLVGVEGELTAFIEALRGFGQKLGPVVFQMSPNFRWPGDFPALRAVLDGLPADIEAAVEFRHPGWYRDEVAAALAERHVAWVLNDLPHLPRAIDRPQFRRVTAPFTYIRLLGDHRAPVTDDHVVFDRAADLGAWAALIAALRPTLRRIDVVVNNHYEGHSPHTIRALAQRLGVPLPDPTLGMPTPAYPQQPALPLFDEPG